jgi:hypothetical protein
MGKTQTQNASRLRTPRKATVGRKSAAKQLRQAKESSVAGVSGHEVTVDRRRGEERRMVEERRVEREPVLRERRQLQRRAAVNRRRQIDPTTCERDYTQDEIEFMNALDEYKRKSGRMFPTCSEVLEVLTGLGYTKVTRAVSGGATIP